MSDFVRLAELLREWTPESKVDQTQFDLRPYKRLAHALGQLQSEPGSVGHGDIAGLIRTVLLHQAADRKRPAELIVRKEVPGFPERDQWKEFGLEVTSRPPDKLKISADVWAPSWLEGGQEDDGVDLPAYNKTSLVQPSQVPMDPALTELLDDDSFTTYRSPGQAMAVRSAFLMGAGETLLVNLPTGQGKSLAFQAPARKGGVSLLVVPTTALAKDHERRVREAGWSYDSIAYHAGLPDAEKKDIRERIRNGTQGIVATSPEAVLSGLKGSLERCAQDGALSYFVVDEAHIIDQWGQEFRPEYQFLGAFRDHLKKLSPSGSQPKTLLLSATITEEVYKTLETLFGDITHVSAVHLRPEIEFWITEASNREEKEARLLEAVRRLPRPFIIYVSTLKDAESFSELVRSAGIKRMHKVIGGIDLEGILEQWSEQKIDVIVATSAFGLGVDNSDVRAVVHASIPESADRFYQEVGRGGRDGKSSISLTIFEDSDWKTARNLSSPRVIKEKAWPHWDAMTDEMKRLEDGEDLWVVDLQAKPLGIYQETGANRHWNEVTLSLMARAGVISLESKLDEFSPDPKATEEELREYRDKIYNEAMITIYDYDVVNKQAVFEDKVLGERQRAAESRSESFRSLQALFKDTTKSVNEALANVYSFGEVDVESPAGRCPHTRENNGGGTHYVPPCPFPPNFAPKTLTGYFSEFDNEPIYLHYDGHAGRWDRDIIDLLRYSVRCGFLEILSTMDWFKKKKVSKLHRGSPEEFVVLSDILVSPCRGTGVRKGAGFLNVPRVIVVPPNITFDQIDGVSLIPGVLHSRSTPQIVVFEKNLIYTPNRPRFYRDEVSNWDTVRGFMAEATEWQS